MSPAERAALADARRLGRAHAHVTGVDFGEARRRGARTGERAVRFHVREKLARAALPPSDVLPSRVGGVATDVIEGRHRLHTSPRASFDPLVAGISVGNAARGSTGTLGAFVRDAATGAASILSCAHVLAGAANATPGDAIVQPGPLHAGATVARPIGALTRALALASGYDAAIAKLEVAHRPEVLGLASPPFAIVAPYVGQRVLKSGAASGVTSARVDGIEGCYRIDYADLGDASRWMEGLHLVVDDEAPVDEIAREGDSGALWIDRTSLAVVALHFAGEDGLGRAAEYALAHPIEPVLAALGVAFA